MTDAANPVMLPIEDSFKNNYLNCPRSSNVTVLNDGGYFYSANSNFSGRVHNGSISFNLSSVVSGKHPFSSLPRIDVNIPASLPLQVLLQRSVMINLITLKDAFLEAKTKYEYNN